MQISMNQGTGLSERNWLTEGCHLCAWKMMDPICKLLLYPTAPPSPPSPYPPSPYPHRLLWWLLNKEENLWLFWKITSGLVKLALYWPFHRTVKEPTEDLWDFRVDGIDYHHGLCFSSSFHFPYRSPRTSTKWNQYLWTYKRTSGAFKILDFACWIGQSTVSFH